MTVNQAGIEAEDYFEITTEMVELNQQFLQDMSMDQGLNLDIKEL